MRPLLALVLTTAALALPASAIAAPVAGPYHGIVNGTPTSPCGGNEGEGWFKLRQSGKIAPLGSARWCGFRITVPEIYAPSAFVCNQGNAKLAVGLIPVDASGFFVHTEEAPIGPGGATRTVTFRGTWRSDTKVTGITRIRGDGCDHTSKWTMKAF